MEQREGRNTADRQQIGSRQTDSRQTEYTHWYLHKGL
jgi:hypothetical protein